MLDEGVDEVIQKYWQRGFGFVISLGPPGNPQFSTIGHTGAGGPAHVAWPELGVTYSYTMTQMREAPDTGGGPVIAAVLVDALHSSVA